MIAANSVSSGVSCVPPPCGRTFDGGISGFAISHSPSGTIQLHVPRPIDSSTSDHHIGHRLSALAVKGAELAERVDEAGKLVTLINDASSGDVALAIWNYVKPPTGEDCFKLRLDRLVPTSSGTTGG